MGREISTQFDALMKMSFEASDHVQIAPNELLPTIPEEIPGMILPQVEEKPIELTMKKSQTSFDSYLMPKRQTFESTALSTASLPVAASSVAKDKWEADNNKEEPFESSFR